MPAGYVRLRDLQNRVILDSESYTSRVIYNERVQVQIGVDFSRTIDGLGSNYMIWVDADDLMPIYSVVGNTVNIRGLGASPNWITIVGVSFG
ncbi:MAG: hypothetical protein [Caudoviricetes sp.]|nr:MAG: hypothetical protein [Caudoviricetes sp.]